MDCRRLSLTNFRNYRRLEIDLQPGRTLIQGANAQGKTNLLEAIYFLATSKSPRASADRELINWEAGRQGQPVARVAGEVERRGRRMKIEVSLAIRADAPLAERAPGGVRGSVSDGLAGSSVEAGRDGLGGGTTKAIRLNDVPRRRAVDLVGQLAVVLFSPVDVNIVDGAPAARRRYLDITNAQVDPRYLAGLQRYTKVITQRNHLLRRCRERRARAGELAFWDQQLVREGSYLIERRRATVDRLNDHAHRLHLTLSRGEHLAVRYVPSASAENSAVLDQEDWLSRLVAAREREIALGQSILGPHRDDLAFAIDGNDVGRFGSRGQQRSVALSLKLAEAAFMTEALGEPPVLLLDDMMSELDRGRRERILADILPAHQVILTATDVDVFPAEFLAQTDRYEVEQGLLRPVEHPVAG